MFSQILPLLLATIQKFSLHLPLHYYLPFIAMSAALLLQPGKGWLLTCIIATALSVPLLIWLITLSAALA